MSPRSSTSTVPMLLEYGGAPPPGSAEGTQVQLSTSSAPIRRTGGPTRFRSATKAALAPVNVPFVMCVFSKLKPANPGPICPAGVLRFTLTVPATVEPAKAGPPGTGVPQPESLRFVPLSGSEESDPPEPASLELSPVRAFAESKDCPLSSREEPLSKGKEPSRPPGVRSELLASPPELVPAPLEPQPVHSAAATTARVPRRRV